MQFEKARPGWRSDPVANPGGFYKVHKPGEDHWFQIQWVVVSDSGGNRFFEDVPTESGWKPVVSAEPEIWDDREKFHTVGNGNFPCSLVFWWYRCDLEPWTHLIPLTPESPVHARNNKPLIKSRSIIILLPIFWKVYQWFWFKFQIIWNADQRFERSSLVDDFFRQISCRGVPSKPK